VSNIFRLNALPLALIPGVAMTSYIAGGAVGVEVGLAAWCGTILFGTLVAVLRRLLVVRRLPAA
jgi:hypothetical protein